jgi:tetratricopeptide (TPR) repeat protein
MRLFLAIIAVATALAGSVVAAPKNTAVIPECEMQPKEQVSLETQLASCDAAIKVDQADTDKASKNYLNRCGLYFQLALYQAAADDCTKSIDLKPSEAAGYQMRGAVYLLWGKLGLSMADEDEAIRLKPAYAAAQGIRGGVFLLSKEYEKAIATFTQAIQLDSTNAEYFNNRGSANEMKGNHDLATADFDQAIKLRPNYATAFKNRCWTHAVQGKELQEALSDCTASIALKPEGADTTTERGFRGFVLLQLGRYAEALDDFNTALQKERNWSFALYGRGLAEFHSDAPADAKRDLDAALAVDKDVGSAYSAVGLTPPPG